MKALLFYLLQVIICSGILYSYYHLFLRNKVYHGYNRFYLLVIVIISLISPLINFNLLFGSYSEASKPVQLLHVVTNGNEYMEELIMGAGVDVVKKTIGKRIVVA